MMKRLLFITMFLVGCEPFPVNEVTSVFIPTLGILTPAEILDVYRRQDERGREPYLCFLSLGDRVPACLTKAFSFLSSEKREQTTVVGFRCVTLADGIGLRYVRFFLPPESCRKYPQRNERDALIQRLRKVVYQMDIGLEIGEAQDFAYDLARKIENVDLKRREDAKV